MTAREKLKEIRKMDVEIDALQEQIDMLHAEAEGLKSMEITDMPKGGKSRDAACAIAEAADMQRERYGLILQRIKKREQALLAISAIDNSEHRTLLIQRYINCKSWDAIVDDMHYSYATIFRMHGVALQEFERVIRDESK